MILQMTTRSGARLQLLPAFMTMIFLVASVAVAAADTIQIGTFSWEAITDDQDEFALFCGADPCSRFTLTNDLGTLTPLELSELGLPSTDVAFDNVLFPGIVGGSLGSLTTAIGSFVWISADPIDSATVLFDIPGGLIGTLLFPTLTGPSADPAAILVDLPSEPPPTTVPEPSAVWLLATGLCSARVWRHARGRVRA
jgi:hypothetical protein